VNRDQTARFLEDAAHFPGGHASGIVFPRSTAEVATVVAGATAILPIGAQSSLTGGATPMGELILSTAKLDRVVESSARHITVEPGVTIAAMQELLASAGAWFPPAPTFTGATAGGIVATNAAGAATFKYGSTRDWVDAVTVVLADGTTLDVVRGRQRAENRRFTLTTASGPVEVPVPRYAMPQVAKRSAGYHAAPDMDLIDLFIGSEGTLGVIAQIRFRIVSPAPASALALIACRSEGQAIDLVRALREQSIATWRTGDAAGVDAAAIEHMDRRSIEILREDGADARHDVRLPPDAEILLVVQLEIRDERAVPFDDIAEALEPGARDSAIGRFCRLLDERGLLDRTEVALPGRRRRAEQFYGIREAVPAGVNRRVGAAKRDIDARIEKTAADMIVPVERFGDLMEVYRYGFASRGLEYAIWGHISDGNVHPNVIPRSFDDVVRGKEAILEFGREAVRLGGCPLAEHGVGRNPVKQALLGQLYGETGIDEMRAVKRALDPGWKLAPGVIFPR
jgi:D-lactate dehydrogenase (cytochrome)